MSSPFSSFVAGQQARQEYDAGQTRNALATMQLQNAPREMQQRNALADQQVQGGQNQLDEVTQKRIYAGAQRVLQSADPKGAAEALFPQFIQDFEAHHGAGSWQQLQPDQVKQIASHLVDQAGMQLGMPPPTQQQTIGDVNNPGNGVLQRDPTTGALKQIVAPQKPPDVQHTQNGLIFDPSKGVYLDPNGKPMNAKQVRDWNISLSGDKAGATANARNQAQASAIAEGDMSTAVSAFRQGIGNPPSMTRNPTAYAAFWNEYKAQAKNEGNTVQQQLADQRISQSLKPAMEQTSKQIAANQGFLGTLEKNIASADELQKRVAGNDPQYMNRVFNAWKRGVSTDPKMAGDIAALDRWNNAIQGEAAKIASGGVGSVSASSDGQIQEQMKLMNSAQTYSAWRSSANAAVEEGKNRMDSLYSSRDSLMHQSAGKSGNAAPPASAPPAPQPAAATPALTPGTYHHSSGAIVTIHP